MKKIATSVILAALLLGAAPAAHAVDPVQEHKISNCYFDKSKTGKQRAKYCNALKGRKMTKVAKNCLLRAGVGSAAALVVGRVNKKAAREIAVNTVGAGAAACLSSLIN
ncbi:hypothetical protein AB0B51_37040 [Streptomyces griseus]|uniref:hypothetical protein n=1 Tax=Streptomyces griseus TaxID=1911 RepID=UPI000A850824|nr:hypothetical protein [Streptomyces griseus]